MELNLSKTLNVGAEYRGRGTPNWETRLLVDVAFIDKTQVGVKPFVYQLHDSVLATNADTVSLNASYAPFSPESFILLGEMSEVDKKNKQIFLSNKNVVSYQYLIVVTGTKSSLSHTEFSAGLHALIEALRVKPKINDSFSIPPILSSFVNNHKRSVDMLEKKALHSSEIEKLVHTYISSSQNEGFSFSFSTNQKRLYEIQL